MATMPDPTGYVTGGVDTHRDSHTVAALNRLGAVLGTATFPATGAGYRQLLSWLASFGPVNAVGVEGTGSWGAGLARHLRAVGVEVREVIRPNRQHRRRYGKSDPADAVAAARSVLNGEADGLPRGGTGPIEGIRLLKLARNSAVKQRTQAANQIRAVIATAPASLRASLEHKTLAQVARTASGYRPRNPTDPYQAAKLTLKVLASRWQRLGQEITGLDTHLDALVQTVAPPALLNEPGIGTQTAADLLITVGDNPQRVRSEASFAALCGTSPVDASSGLQLRHRLNRGGDRQANATLHRIIIVRLRYHQPTRQYMARRLAQGKTKKEIIRCLKRALARQVYNHLTTS
jgi:transposase